ncbi:ribonuclease domain-containing protein [Streptomyces celluloflavus]|uniref:ribonuclease domain-containing protein n=1 Tax=Streptomyces celluloflavus TaxID=58344 RepID=UPI0036D9356D
MTTFCDSRRAAATALLLTALIAQSAPAATAVTSPDLPLHQVRGPADVIDPPLPVEQFPVQIKKACGIWKKLHWPSADRPTDYAVEGTKSVIRGSNVYGNRSGDLPAGGHYREYDVNSRPPGQHRDAERIVRDTGTRTVWYTGDHYNNFRKISSGCP